MKPRINLCVYNHDWFGILDQIWFAKEVFAQHGYELICGKALRLDCINLLIENFVEHDIATYEAFCRKSGKQIGIIMTEHVELEDEGFSFNGTPLGDAEYIANKEQRLFSALSLAEHTFAFFTLGELPELRTLSKILPSRRVYRLPYPSIQQVTRRPNRHDHDIVFTGAMTTYRESILKQAAKRYRLIQSEPDATEDERMELYSSAKVAVNIPQTKDWKWISPMRVLFGLRVGTPTVHIGHRDETLLSKLVLDPIDLDVAVQEHEMLFHKQIGCYEDFVKSSYNSPFPDGLFDVWAEMELRP